MTISPDQGSDMRRNGVEQDLLAELVNQEQGDDVGSSGGGEPQRMSMVIIHLVERIRTQIQNAMTETCRK